MVDAIGPTNRGSVETLRTTPQSTPLTRTGAVARAAASGSVPNPAADLAAWGPVVDEARIAGLREAIAQGSYKPDPQAIAAKMIALDLPKPAAK